MRTRFWSTVFGACKGVSQDVSVGSGDSDAEEWGMRGGGRREEQEGKGEITLHCAWR